MVSDEGMASEELTWMPGWQLRTLMLEGKISPVEVTQHFLHRIEALDSDLHSFLTVAPDDALRTASQLETELRRGSEPGPLWGLPISIKDQFWTAGMRSTGGSLVFAGHVPQQDSVYAERVRRAGAVIVGKSNTPEFGLFGRTTNRLGPETVNPWDGSRTSGGSSGGAAASVAAGMTPLAIGSDGGGSIRMPAAFCGVYGLHPSNGRVPRHGSFGGALFFSGVGPITRDVRDAAILFQVLAGPDQRDPTCLRSRPPDYLKQIEDGVGDLRMAWWSDCGEVAGLDSRVTDLAHRASARFADMGARVGEPDLKLEVEGLWEAFSTISNADRYALLGQQLYEDPSVRGLLTHYAAEAFSKARHISGAEYARALRARFRFMAKLETVFETYDLILSPTCGTVAPSIDPAVVETSPASTCYTYTVNFAGVAAATIPCGSVDGLPVGLQMMAKLDDEATILRASRAFERSMTWTDTRPPLEAKTTAGTG